MLGWIISGTASSSTDNEKKNTVFPMAPASSYLPADIHLITTKRESTLFEPNIEELWNLETIKVKPKGSQEREDLVMQTFKNAATKEDRRHQVSWPWRTQNHDLLENYEPSLGRLKALIKRIEKDRDLLQCYDEIIKDQLSNE